MRRTRGVRTLVEYILQLLNASSEINTVELETSTSRAKIMPSDADGETRSG
jgi:hypothetical protein